METVTKFVKNIGRNQYSLWLYGQIISTVKGYYDDTFEATEIIDKLWLGNLSSASNRNEMKKNGIDTIVSAAIGVRTLYPNDFNYITVPLRDVEDEPILNYVIDILPKIHEVISRGGSVLVHCMMGVSRSATIVACYLMKYKNMNHTDVLDYMKTKRSIVNPNNGYLKSLENFENILSEENSNNNIIPKKININATVYVYPI